MASQKFSNISYNTQIPQKLSNWGKERRLLIMLVTITLNVGCLRRFHFQLLKSVARMYLLTFDKQYFVVQQALQARSSRMYGKKFTRAKERPLSTFLFSLHPSNREQTSDASSNDRAFTVRPESSFVVVKSPAPPPPRKKTEPEH